MPATGAGARTRARAAGAERAHDGHAVGAAGASAALALAAPAASATTATAVATAATAAAATTGVFAASGTITVAAAGQLGRRARLVVEVGQDHARDRLAEEALDGRQVLRLLGRHQREGVAQRVDAARATDAVHVVLGRVRHVVVDDVRDVGDVDAARGDVGRHQHLHLAAAQVGQRALALSLRAVAVQRRDRVAEAIELAGQAVGAVLGAREHDHAAHAGHAQQLVEQRRLQVLDHGIDGLRDAGGRPRGRRQVDAARIAHRLLGDLVEVGRHRGREHERLPLVGQQAQDAVEVGREAHVDHAVGLVEDEHLHLVERQALAAVQVEQAARGGDEQVDARVAQHALLRADRDAAVHDAHPQRGEARVVAGVGLDLGGQFAGRREHERAQALSALEQAGEDGQQECRGLAGAGLRGPDQVAAGQDHRNRLRLDRRGLGVTGGAHALQKRCGQAECFESQKNLLRSLGYGRRVPRPRTPRARAPAAPADVLDCGSCAFSRFSR